MEQWGAIRLVRPDPTAAGVTRTKMWQTADAIYEGEKGKGNWVVRSGQEMPAEWVVEFGDLKMQVKLSPYKHTGVFPEQEENWKWMRAEAQRAAARVGRELRILNLFAYTGGATMALAKQGHFVTHVDSSKPAVTWGRVNAGLNELGADRVRWMLEDAATFVARERKREKFYDGIVLDPPAFGHSPTGKAWVLGRDLGPLLEDCCALLSDDAGGPAFVVLNGYAQHNTPESLRLLLAEILRRRFGERMKIDGGELMLRAADGRELSTGIVARGRFA